MKIMPPVLRNPLCFLLVLTAWLSSSQDAAAQCDYKRAATYEEFALTNEFANLNALGEIQYEDGYNPTADLDGDGLTNREEWQGYTTNVISGGVFTSETRRTVGGSTQVVYFGWSSDTPTGVTLTNNGSCLTEVDSDEDGVGDMLEAVAGTNPRAEDTDRDGMLDQWELRVGLDPLDNGTSDPDQSGSMDPDGDGLTNIEENEGPNDTYARGGAATTGMENTAPEFGEDDYTLPFNVDSDGDELIDSFEYDFSGFLNPVVADDANADPDSDGLTTFREQCIHPLLSEYWSGNSITVDQFGSGYMNLAEFNEPANVATNFGGVLWGHPVNDPPRWTNPNNPDSDADLLPDGWEVEHGLNPLAGGGTFVEYGYEAVSGPFGDPDQDNLFNYQEYLGADGHRIDRITGTGDETSPWITRARNLEAQSTFAAAQGKPSVGNQGDQSPNGYPDAFADGGSFTNAYHPTNFPGFFDPEQFATATNYVPIPGVPPFVPLNDGSSFNPFATAIAGLIFADNDNDGVYNPATDDLWLDSDPAGLLDVFDGADQLINDVTSPLPDGSVAGLPVYQNVPRHYPMPGLDTDDDGLTDEYEIQLAVDLGYQPSSPVQSFDPFVPRAAWIRNADGIAPPDGIANNRFFARDFTVETWVYLNGNGGAGVPDYRGAFVRGIVSVAGRDRSAFEIGIGAVGGESSVPFVAFETLFGKRYQVAASGTIPLDQWVHLAGVFNNNANSLSLYVNGILEQSLQVNEDSVATWGIANGGSVRLGVDDAGANVVAGNLWLDEVRIWGVPRSAAQVADNRFQYVEPVQPTPVNVLPSGEPNSLFAYYTFDDGGDTAEDLTRRAKSSLLGYDYPSDEGSLTRLQNEYWYGDQAFALPARDVATGVTNFIFDPGRAAPVAGRLDTERGSFDSDADGLPDAWEVVNGLNPFRTNTPAFSAIDIEDAAWRTATGLVSDALADPDEDGLNNQFEFWARTNPRQTDTDADGLFDGSEDFDGDGLPNAVEANQRSRPDLQDTDDDGFTDAEEQGGLASSSGSPTLSYSSKSPRYNQALRLDGQPYSYLEVPERAALRLSTWTIEARFQPAADANWATNQGAYLVRRVVEDATNGIQAATFELRVVNLTGGGVTNRLFGEARYTYVDQAGRGYTNMIRSPLTNNAVIATNAMTHLAATYDSDSGRLTLYKDGGESASTQTALTRPPVNGRGPLVFTRIGEGFAGDIDEVRIWDVVRSPDDIRDDAFLSLTGTETNAGLVSLFTIDDGGLPFSTDADYAFSDVIRSVRFATAPLSPCEGDTWLEAVGSITNFVTFESGQAVSVLAPARVFHETNMLIGAASDGDFAFKVSERIFYRYDGADWVAWGPSRHELLPARSLVLGVLSTTNELRLRSDVGLGDRYLVESLGEVATFRGPTGSNELSRWVFDPVYETDRFLVASDRFEVGVGPLVEFDGVNVVTIVDARVEGLYLPVLNEGVAYKSNGTNWMRWGSPPSVEDYSTSENWENQWNRAARLRGAGQLIRVGAEVEDDQDSDGDGLPDAWEVNNGLDPNDPTGDNGADGDPDGDGLRNINEYLLNYNPTSNDTDGNGIEDGLEDFDGDGLTNLYEQDVTNTRLDSRDTDDDGVDDYAEAIGDPRTSNPISSLDPPKRQSLLLNGTNHVIVADQERHALPSWTLQAWVRPTNTVGGIIIQRRVRNPRFGSEGINYELGIHTNGGSIRPYVRYAGFDTNGLLKSVEVDGTNEVEVTGGQLGLAEIKPDVWTHVAATYSPSASTLQLYVDGVLVAYRVDAFPPAGLGVTEGLVPFDGELTIGGGGIGTNGVVADGFEGYLDDVSILAGVVNAENIAASASGANNLTASLRLTPTVDSYAPVMLSVDEALEFEHRTDEMLVRFNSMMTPSDITAFSTNMGIASSRSYSLVPVHLMTITDSMSLSEKLTQVRSSSSVLFAEPNYRLTSFRSPNDPSYASQWALNNTGQTGGTPGVDIQAEETWETTTGNSAPIVAIIDGGIDYNHADISANMWGGIGYDFWEYDDDPMDLDGHGTHVAGTVGAVGNNGVGIAGVAWRTRLMAVRFISEFGFGFTADAIAGIEYAVANGAEISNNSWGGYGYSQALYDAIAAAGNAGHLFIAAAGNSNFSNDILPAYPASYALPNIISVASMDANGNKSSFSNYGRNTVHIAAPGSAILSTLPGNTYGNLSGTSMAAPHVTGVASLILSQNPNASYTAIRSAILNAVDVQSNWTEFVMSGGTLNAARAVGGAGTPVLHFTFNDGGETVEDYSIEMDWNNDWAHAGTLVDGAAFSTNEFFESKRDSNEDGIPDWWAETYGFDPFTDIAMMDEDGDGLNNLNEYLAGTHPREADTDRDGTSDANEDSDGDGLTNLQEQIAGTHPGEADSDDDGVSDDDEVNGSTNPLDPYSPQNFRATQFGGNGRVLVGTERDIDDHQNWTLEAWVKPDAAAADGIILRRAEKIDSANRWVDYELGLDAGVPYIRYAYRDGGTLKTERVDAPWPIDTRWHHLAAVMDDTDHQLRLFVNGKRVAFARPAIRPPVSAFGAFETTIGGGDYDGVTVTNGFRGQIDAVRVWDYARSGLEIQNNRHTLRPEFSAAGVPDANRAPIRLFNFDDGGDTAQNDYYTEDWLNDWIHAAELQGDAGFTAAPFPPLDLDSDDDGIPDQQENTEAWDHLASESPFAYRALSFDGTGDVLVDELVDNENTAQYALTNWTIEAWVRPTALPPVGLQPLISRTDRATGLLTFELGVVRIDNALYPYARFNRADSGNDLVALNVSESIPVGADEAWTHLAASLEDNVFSLYLNGAEAQSSTLIGALPYIGGPGEVRLGSTGFVGQMQEIRIWNEPRAADQVAADYRNALIFSSAQLQSSFQSATTYLGRSTQAEEDGLVYDYSSTLQYESVPYLAGRATHKFSLMAWVKLEQGATGGIVAERKVDVLLNDTEPDWRINHSLRITESGQPQGLWMGDVTVYNPVREDPDGDGPIGEIVVRLEAAPEVITRTITSEVDLRDGQWHHVALVGDSQRVRIYIDGRLDTEAQSYYVFKARDGESFEGFYRTYMPINSVLRMADEGFDGTLDEVMFWNEDVAEADLMQYMNLGLSRADIELGTAPIDPLPDFALDPEEPRQRLISYLNFDGEIELPFIGDRINNRTEYRVLPSATGSEILNPSAPPVQSDRVLAYEMGLRGYFAAYDGGAHIENLMQRNHYGYAGVLRNGTDFVVLTADDVDHLADDADGDGLPDLWEMLYGLDSGSAEGDQGRFGDPDGDGLNNLAEYLAGTNPLAFDTDGDGISDFDSIQPGSSLTNGDRFTDNDGIADEWESQYPGVMDTDRDDASEDPDGDGWDNFSEFMAGTDPSDPSSWPTPSISARFDYLGAKDQGPIRLNIFSSPDMSGLPDAIATAGATLTQNGEVGEVGQDGTTASGTFPAVPVAPGSILLSVGCSPNTVLQFEDLGNGVLRSINVVPTRFGQIDYESGEWNVILTPTALSPGQSVCASWEFFFGVPSFPFLGDISVVRGHIRQGPIWLQAFIDNNLDGLWNLDEPMGLAQQQPINIDWTGPVDLHIGLIDELEGYHRLSWPDTGSPTYTVAVRRVTTSGSPIFMRHVVTGRNYLHEGDYQAAGFYGLPADSSFRPGYQAFVGAFSTNFSFDWRSSLATPQALSPVGFQTKAKVTLTWSSTSEAVQNQIEIRAVSEAGPIVWSGTIPTPFRDAVGQYRYTLPILAGDAAMPEGVYYWRVRSLNPQQTSSYSTWKTFAVALGDSASSYSIAGEARYFGSLTAPGSVIVEAYTSAGFSGEPAARVTLTAPGAYRLGGLAAGTYSVRAWLDQDGDGELDVWETRGYLMADSSTIKSLALPTSQIGQHVSLRGRDSNNNGIADDWEYATFGALVANPQFVDSDNDGLADWEELFVHDTDPYLKDSMGDGLSDGDRVDLGLDTRKMDNDEDGYADALELALGSNPLNPASTPAADDLFQIVSVSAMADRDVVTYDMDAAVGVLLRDVDVTVSYSSSLMLPFTPLSGSSRSIFTTNWIDGPWSYTNAPPAGSSLFYRIDWRLKN